jgi:hypothetical protein
MKRSSFALLLALFLVPSTAAALDPGTPTQQRVEQPNLNLGSNTYGFFLEPGDLVILNGGDASTDADRAATNWCSVAQFADDGTTHTATLTVTRPWPALGNNVKYIVKDQFGGTTYYLASNPPNSGTALSRATYSIDTSTCAAPAPVKKEKLPMWMPEESFTKAAPPPGGSWSIGATFRELWRGLAARFGQ